MVVHIMEGQESLSAVRIITDSYNIVDGLFTLNLNRTDRYGHQRHPPVDAFRPFGINQHHRQCRWNVEQQHQLYFFWRDQGKQRDHRQ